MSGSTTFRAAPGLTAVLERSSFDLHVRGEVPAPLSGSLVVATSRRHKNRSLFCRWHDSQSDLLRLDLYPGRPGRVKAHFLAIDPTGEGLLKGYRHPSFYVVQPNHGINIEGTSVWATNLLFGAPVEVDLVNWTPRRILRYVQPDDSAPQITSTSHFAWSLDHRYAYFHQSLLERESGAAEVRAAELRLIQLDTQTGGSRIWEILAPSDDASMESANFHSAFYYEEGGRRFVGLLRTGAILECLEAHTLINEHRVTRMPSSTIWILELDDTRITLQANLLPGVDGLSGFALSHLDVDVSTADGFILYANYKQTDVAEETHSENIYGERPEDVTEHYSGMVVEPFNYGLLLRYERRNGNTKVQTFSRPYSPGQTSLGHTWLPINIQLDSARQSLFCTFSGFHPRLLPRHIAAAYADLVVDAATIRYVPPLLMRFDADTLEPDYDRQRRHLSYAESVAMSVVGDGNSDYVCTFSPELGLRIYPAGDLTRIVCHAVSASLMHWKDTHFRPEPAHMQFVPR
jgi:hypothetical protein